MKINPINPLFVLAIMLMINWFVFNYKFKVLENTDLKKNYINVDTSNGQNGRKFTGMGIYILNMGYTN